MISGKCQHVCSFEGANLYSSLAQSVEHAAVNRSVVGSSPTGGAFLCRKAEKLGGINIKNEKFY